MKSSATFAFLASAGSAAAFWRMPCRSTTGIGRIDPIVSPGEVADHAHIIFGGGNFGMNTDYDDLAHATGDLDCTSCEVTQDKSAYWTPPLFFQYDNGTVEMVPNVGGMLAYYLFYLDNLEPFPEGFKVVAGNPFIRNFTGPFPDEQLSFWPIIPSDQFFLEQRAIGFNCLNYDKDPEPSLYRHTLPSKDYMDANCKDGLRLEFAFPSCGNGQMDSPDHKSHVQYPSLVKEGNCPEGYDHHYPFLFFETIWATNKYLGVDGKFVLSPGDPVGTGYHADFVMGWSSADFLGDAIKTCTNPSGEISDCPLFDIQSDSDAAKCTFPVPDAVKDDNIVGPRDGMPVNVPVQYGPSQATKYPVAGQSNVPTSSLQQTSAPTTFTEGPTLSYSAADPAVTSTAQGGIIVAAKSGGPIGESDSTQAAYGKDKAATQQSSQASQASQSSQTTAAPDMASSSGDIVATSYMTTGQSVIEMLMEEVQVTVTASPTAGSMRNKRHLHHHLHQQI